MKMVYFSKLGVFRIRHAYYVAFSRTLYSNSSDSVWIVLGK